MNDEAKSMKVLFSIGYDEDPLGTLTCTRGMTTTMEVTAWIFSKLEHGDLFLPPTTGSTRHVEVKDYDIREWLTVTVLNEPKK